MAEDEYEVARSAWRESHYEYGLMQPLLRAHSLATAHLYEPIGHQEALNAACHQLALHLAMNDPEADAVAEPVSSA